MATEDFHWTRSMNASTQFAHPNKSRLSHMDTINLKRMTTDCKKKPIITVKCKILLCFMEITYHTKVMRRSTKISLFAHPQAGMMKTIDCLSSPTLSLYKLQWTVNYLPAYKMAAILQTIFSDMKSFFISIIISLKFVPKSLINYNTALV